MKDVIIAVIAKKEDAYIREFVEHHLAIGFDKIIIGDNNDIDYKDPSVGKSLQGELDSYMKAGKVDLIDLRGQIGMQNRFYEYVCNNYDYEWCACIDADEFICFAPESNCSDIKDFLEDKGEWNIIKLNWMMFGDNGNIKKTEGSLMERFVEPLRPEDPKEFRENAHIKSIINSKCKLGNYITFPSPHNPIGDYLRRCSPNGEDCKPYESALGAWVLKVDYSVLYIKHFYTKTLEEWVKYKMHRGYADRAVDFKTTYSLDRFFEINECTQEKIDYLKSLGISYTPKALR